MKNKEFIQKYEELLDSGYCECNELNCLDNNPPRKILSIMKEQDKEIERLNSIIKEVREYIENNQEEHKFTDRGGFTYTEGHFLRDSDSLLEILDKVEEK